MANDEWEPPEVRDEDLASRFPDWVNKRIEELKAEGLSPTEAATVILREARKRVEE